MELENLCMKWLYAWEDWININYNFFGFFSLARYMVYPAMQLHLQLKFEN